MFAETESTKGQPDLSVSEMKLRSEINLDGDQRQSAEAGTASETLVDSFDERERTLIRPDFEPSEDLEREEVERTEETSERSEDGGDLGAFRGRAARGSVIQGNVQIGDQES